MSGDDLAAEVRRVEQALLARTPESDPQPSLERVEALLDLLGSPQHAVPLVHLTGTNGKTSTARMVDALLRGFGLRTGRFTSPHVHRIQERIAIEGAPIDDERFVAAYDDVAPYLGLVDARSEIPTTFFEVLTAMAYAAFADTPVDAAVVEVGMGGTWDATNVGNGRVAVVTPVAVDHARFLGSTPAEIAVEKAGILKEGTVGVLAQQDLDVAEVLLRRSVEVGASVVREGLEFGVVDRTIAVGGQQIVLQGLGGTYDQLFLPLHGAHQAHNAACALAATEAFLGGGAGRLDIDVVRSALASVTSPGRLEVVRRSPTVVLDSAHNPAGAAATAAAIGEAFAFTRLVGLVAVLGDKDVRGVLEALEPVLADLVVSEAPSPRAMPVDDLAAVAVEVFGADRVEVVPRLPDAVDVAVALAEEEGDLGGAGVLVTGSVVTVGAVRGLFGRAGA